MSPNTPNKSSSAILALCFTAGAMAWAFNYGVTGHWGNLLAFFGMLVLSAIYWIEVIE